MRAPLVSISLLLSCGGSSAEQPPTQQPPPRAIARIATVESEVDAQPPPRSVPDAVEAGPGVYEVALENEHVRVLLATYEPGAKVPMHRHPDHVVFALAGGAAVFEKAGEHELDVAAPAATRAVLVELGIKRGSPAPAGDDPVAAPRRIYNLLLDQPRVRVLDVTFGKGKSRPAALGDHVLLAREKATLVWTPAGGAARSLALEPGMVLFFPAGVYTAINAKRESIAVVLFELKP